MRELLDLCLKDSKHSRKRPDRKIRDEERFADNT